MPVFPLGQIDGMERARERDGQTGTVGGPF